MAALQKTLIFNTALLKPNTTIIVGFSGGPDSVYLLHQLVALRPSLHLTLFAAHLDHEWRSSSSIDAAFCKKFCESLFVPLVLKKASELTHSHKANGSMEALGRALRRSFFEELAREKRADAIALAHHQDDQHETFFINLIRGTSIAGLCGMKEVDGLYIRPLLALTKQSILSFLKEQGISYCLDPTNDLDTFLRNKIRSTLIPALLECDDRSKKNLSRLMNHLQNTKDALDAYCQLLLFQLTNQHEGNECINLPSLFALPIFMQKQLMLVWISKKVPTFRTTDAFLNEILIFLKCPRNGTHTLLNGWALVKKEGHLFLNITA